MKRIMPVLILFVMMPVFCSAQKIAFNTLYDKYSSREGSVTFEMEGTMFEMMLEGDQSQDLNPLNGIERIRSIVVPLEDQEFVKEIEALPGSEGYKLLLTINDKSTLTRMYYRIADSKSKKVEYLLLSSGDKDNSAIYIYGLIDPNALANMANAIKK